MTEERVSNEKQPLFVITFTAPGKKAWVVEIDELVIHRLEDRTHVKNFFTKQFHLIFEKVMKEWTGI